MRKCTISWTLKGNSWFQWGPVYNIIYVYRCMVEGYIDYVCSLRNHVLPCSWESNTFVLLRRLTYSMFPQNTVSVDLAVWKTKNWCKLKGYPFICSNFLNYPQCRFLVIFTAKYGNFDSPVYYNSSPQQTSKPLYCASVIHVPTDCPLLLKYTFSVTDYNIMPFEYPCTQSLFRKSGYLHVGEIYTK